VASDLVLVIHQAKHARFERHGNDLHATVKLPLVAALTGGSTSVQHLDGRSLKLPTEGLVVKPGTVVRLPGEGMPISKQPGQAGDLVVHFDVQFPGRLDEQQKRLIKQALG
jgi:DnaJ-class molecular chaperone